nr:hypothetical protein [Tanacetum cinerariifolium]
MTTVIKTSTIDSQMRNNIMAAGSRGSTMNACKGIYAQWQSRFLRYIDTRPNGDALRKFILGGPYTPFTVIILAVPATDDSLEVLKRTAKVNEIRVERIPKNENTLALVDAAQQYPNLYYQA